MSRLAWMDAVIVLSPVLWGENIKLSEYNQLLTHLAAVGISTFFMTQR